MEHFEYEDAKIIVEIGIDSHDFDSFHDAIISASNKHLNQQELLEVFYMLPLNIKTTAIQFGMYDTEFREQVYEWAKENIDKLEKYTTWID